MRLVAAFSETTIVYRVQLIYACSVPTLLTLLSVLYYSCVPQHKEEEEQKPEPKNYEFPLEEEIRECKLVKEAMQFLSNMLRNPTCRAALRPLFNPATEEEEDVRGDLTNEMEKALEQCMSQAPKIGLGDKVDDVYAWYCVDAENGQKRIRIHTQFFCAMVKLFNTTEKHKTSVVSTAMSIAHEIAHHITHTYRNKGNVTIEKDADGKLVVVLEDTPTNPALEGESGLALERFWFGGEFEWATMEKNLDEYVCMLVTPQV